MQLEITIPVCPLCKQEALVKSSGQVTPTRLCAACQSMVQTILPTRWATANAYSTIEPASAAQARGMVEAGPSVALADAFPVERDFDEHEATRAGFAEQDFIELDESTTDLYEEVEESDPGHPSDSTLIADPPAWDSSPEIDLLDDEPLSLSTFDEPVTFEPEGSVQEESRPAEVVMAEEVVEPEPAQPALVAEPTEITEPAAIAAPVEVCEAAQPVEQQTSDYKEAVDPWDDPLPAWDYSVNEYPTLLMPERATGNRGWMKIAAVVTLIAVVGAAGYFILSKRSAGAVSEGAASALSITEAGAVKPAAQAIAQPESRPAANSTPAAETGAPVATQAAAAPVRAHLPEEGDYSLQAASLPNESAANEFAQKMARVGVEARVVAADLGRKGRWYRIRVGRFRTAADAENFARTATASARAAGMSLQLMVCDYEKP